MLRVTFFDIVGEVSRADVSANRRTNQLKQSHVVANSHTHNFYTALYMYTKSHLDCTTQWVRACVVLVVY